MIAYADAARDDALFVRLADSIAQGQWLGTFDDTTLAKGPGFPVFLAVVATLELPLKVVEQAASLGSAALMSYVVSRLTRLPSAGLILFAALAFNPVSLSDPSLA